MWGKIKQLLTGNAGSPPAGPEANPVASQDAERVRAAYATLGLPEGADLNTARRAWKARLKEMHRDHYADDPATQRRAQEATQKLNDAYQILSDALF